MNIETLRALVSLGIPFEEAYGQCWRDLVSKENHKSDPMFRDPEIMKKISRKFGGRPMYGETPEEARKRKEKKNV